MEDAIDIDVPVPEAKPKGKKAKSAEAPKGPSNRAMQVAGQIIALLEGLPPGERGYASNRLSTYLIGSSVKVAKKSLSKGKKTVRPKVSDWKAKWEDTPEYKEWQRHIAENKGKAERSPAEVATYGSLKDAAFRLRDTIKASSKGSAKTTADKSKPKGKPTVPADTAARAPVIPRKRPRTEEEPAPTSTGSDDEA